MENNDANLGLILGGGSLRRIAQSGAPVPMEAHVYARHQSDVHQRDESHIRQTARGGGQTAPCPAPNSLPSRRR